MKSKEGVVRKRKMTRREDALGKSRRCAQGLADATLLKFPLHLSAAQNEPPLSFSTSKTRTVTTIEMPITALRTVSKAQNGVGAFVLQCKRLDFHYCDWAGASKGMK